MELILHSLGETRRIHGYNPASKTLQGILGPHATAVDWCRVNGHPVTAWEGYTPQPADRIDLWLRPGFGIIEGTLLTYLLVQVAISVVMFGISYGLGLLLNNRPDPTQPGTPEQTFGIAGLSNTIVLGTPKTLVYGTRRVFGHLIGTTVEAGATGMLFGALYFMGEGEITNLRAVEINEIPIGEFPNTRWDWRPGTADQPYLSQWREPHQVYYDGRALELQKSVVYQTHNDRVSSLWVIIQLPYLQHIRYSGSNSFREEGRMDFRIEYKRLGAGVWLKKRDVYIVRDTSASVYFWSELFTFGSPGRWQVRVTLIDNTKNDQQPSGVLYNVEEIQTSPTLTYPHNALLEIRGVASNQITSFEGMKVSALIDGRKVKTWNGVTYTTRFSRNRVWVLRDLLTDPRVGMGHRFPESLWDEPAALAAATYYMGEIDGEPRDVCDVLINQRRPAWDWIRELLTEGNAALIPSRGKLKYVLDRPQLARQAYGEPSSILENSVSMTLGTSGDPVNTVRGEFSDVEQNYRLSLVEVEASDKGQELLNESTVSFKSLTRLSQVERALAYGLKKQRNVQRRWVWQTSLDAIPAEPFDVIRLSYLSPTNRYGYAGFLQGGCTALHLVLDQLIPLDAGENYEVLVRFEDDPVPQTRTFIAQATREQATLQVAPALPRIPQPGDRYFVGLLAQSIATVLLDQVNLDTTNMTYTLSGAEYRADIYDSAGTGVLPQTAKLFHDFPALYAADDVPRYHASYSLDAVQPQREATATMEPWPGAQLYRSRETSDEEYDLSYQGAPLPCQGTALTALPAPTVASPAGTTPQTTDRLSTVEVEVTGGVLTTITWGELQMGFNYFWLGQELLQFRVATFLGTTGAARRYRLSDLRRGLRGTDLRLGTHQVGEACILLGTGIFTRDILASERHRTRRWKSPTMGDDVALVPYTPYAVPSNNLRPWPVASPRGVRRQDGTWQLSWRGRARFLAEWLHETEALPDYDFVAYELTIYQDASRATVVHQVQLGQPLEFQTPIVYQYSLTQQEVDFGAGQTTLHWQVVQLGLDDVSEAAPLVSVEGEGT